MSRLSGLSLIGGYPTAGDTGKEFFAVNPATGKALSPTYHSATLQQVAAAALATHEAFASYRNLPGRKRAEFLRTIAQNIEAIVGDLVDRVNQETALAEQRIRSEVSRTSHQFRMFAAILEEGHGRRPYRNDVARPPAGTTARFAVNAPSVGTSCGFRRK